MPHFEEWTRLSAHIQSLIKASEVAATIFSPLSRNDDYGSFIDLGRQAKLICLKLRSFSETLEAPEGEIKQIIEAATSEIESLLPDPNPNTVEIRQIYIRAALIKLTAAECQISYLLSDRQSEIRSRTERGFEHLQRMIVVDNSFAERWRAAFQAGEVACEKLGAVHLLGHGIWAFKVSASGARTDLVYQHPLVDIDRIDRASDGLVLTEWKKLTPRDNVETVLNDARRQAEKYAKGVLGGNELARIRYLVLVSNVAIDLPDDFATADILYRHLNIAVEPRVPSKG